MLSLGDARHKGQYPDGDPQGMPPAWKAAAIAELDRRHKDPTLKDWYGRSRVELARRLGVDKSLISKMLVDKPGKRPQFSSKVVAQMSAELGIDVPYPTSDAETEGLSLLRRMDEDTRKLAVEMLRRLVK
jgi:hypothetical protein